MRRIRPLREDVPRDFGVFDSRDEAHRRAAITTRKPRPAPAEASPSVPNIRSASAIRHTRGTQPPTRRLTGGKAGNHPGTGWSPPGTLARQRSVTAAIANIRLVRLTLKFAPEEKVRIVLEGLRGEQSISELCRREGIAANLYYRWGKDFLKAGKKQLAGDTVREATSDEVKELRAENSELKEVVAEFTRWASSEAYLTEDLLSDLREIQLLSSAWRVAALAP